ncbi:MAG: spore coat-associated protein, partial [Gaiellaceae bacterium]|nr:spore coat-associated protein [Gaiellaceae bacterium]
MRPTTTTPSLSAKLIASIAVLGVAAAIAGLGTFATFTSSTSASQTIASGTLSLTSGPTNRLGTGATAIAAGDTMQRAIDLNYAGSVDFGSTTLTTSASSSSALDTDVIDGLHLAIDKCSV